MRPKPINAIRCREEFSVVAGRAHDAKRSLPITIVAIGRRPWVVESFAAFSAAELAAVGIKICAVNAEPSMAAGGESVQEEIRLN